jgi:fluoroquinolone transport system permease protein
MQLTTSFNRLGQIDVRLIGRDLFLIYLLFYINALAVIMRLALPHLDSALASNALVAFSLPDWYPMLVAYVSVFLGSALIGMIFGFVLLEERDSRTLDALLVTPLRLDHYLGYRVGVPMAFAFVQVIVSVLVTSVAVAPIGPLIAIAAGASLAAPITSLYFATFAANKVQGLALTKFIGAAGFLIPLAWFTPAPLQYLFGLFPPFWVSKAYWLALDGNPLWFVAWSIGVALQGFVVVALARRFNRVAHHD